MMRTLSMCLVLTIGLSAGTARADDWPMWRCDAARRGATGETLGDELHLQWTLALPPLVPAWPNEPRLGFDASYEPVVAGQTLVVGCPDDGSVRAFDVVTGTPRWRFYSEGPVRFAPVLNGKHVYAVSDDGYLYCLRLADGALEWKVRGAPDELPDQRQLGNNRLVSHWPARGGPVLADGRLYFAAGIWPTMGVYVLAVDADTGAIRWRNDALGQIDDVRLDHNELGPSGLSPQGYLLIHGDQLLAPNGRSMPAALDRRTGALAYYIQGYRHGDCRVIAADEVGLVGESGVIDLRTGREVGSRWSAAGADAPHAFSSAKADLFEGPMHPYKMFPGCTWRSALRDGVAYGIEAGVVYAYDLRGAGVSEYEAKLGERTLHPWRWDAPLVWKLGSPVPRGGPGMVAMAGDRLYAGDGKGLLAVALPVDGQPARIVWRKDLDAEPTSIIAAAGRLFVVTKAGDTQCYGPQPPQGPPPRVEACPAPIAPSKPASEAARRAVAQLSRAAGADEGYCVLLGVGRGDLLGALLQDTQFNLIGVDESRETIARLREELAAQGVYGSRVELFTGRPAEFHFPPYLANLIVAQDQRAAGFPDSSAARLLDALRPYGGTLCVAAPADQQPAFTQWVAQSGGESPEVQRCDDWAVARRCGPLPGATAWTHECGDAARSYFSRDSGVRAPLSVLWYGDGADYGFWKHKDYGTGVKPQVVDGRLIAFQAHTRLLIAYDVYTGRVLWKQPVDSFTRYVCLHDGIYVAGGNQLRVLDPATGQQRASWLVEIEPGQQPFVADIRVDGELAVVALAAQKVRVIERGLWDSTLLVALDRHTGRTLWRRAAQHRFNNHALAVGDGLVFAIDSLSPIETDRAQRQGATDSATEQPSTILALDGRTGEVRWTHVVPNPYRTYGIGGWTTMRTNDDWLAYAAELGVVIAGKFNRAAAYHADSGERAWDAQLAPGQPWILRGDTAVSQSGQVIDLRTGKPSGEALPLRRGGCNYAVGNEQMILLRNRSVCYVDAQTRESQSLYAVRSGCSNSLIAADGLVSVPNFAYGCICNYPVQTSFAMVHRSEAE